MVSTVLGREVNSWITPAAGVSLRGKYESASTNSSPFARPDTDIDRLATIVTRRGWSRPSRRHHNAGGNPRELSREQPAPCNGPTQAHGDSRTFVRIQHDALYQEPGVSSTDIRFCGDGTASSLTTRGTPPNTSRSPKHNHKNDGDEQQHHCDYAGIPGRRRADLAHLPPTGASGQLRAQERTQTPPGSSQHSTEDFVLKGVRTT